MEAILCEVTEVLTKHPDYRIRTDFRACVGNICYWNAGVPSPQTEAKELAFKNKLIIDNESFCSPGIIKVGTLVIRFEAPPIQLLKKHCFDLESVFGEKICDCSIDNLSNRMPRRSICIPKTVFFGDATHVKHWETQEHVPTNTKGLDYAEVMGWFMFSGRSLI